jgi:prepilin-type processing-associated H-X9-DG protein
LGGPPRKPFDGINKGSGLIEAASTPPVDPLSVPGLEDEKKSEESATIKGVDESAAKGKKKGAPAPAWTPGSPLFVGGFSAGHPQGAQFAFGDGSVRFLGNTTSGTLLKQLGNRADGKILDEF